jgi:two-component system cell cycle response regulator DivK
MPGERILAVDDNPLNLALLRAVLKSRGYDLRMVQNADEALAALPGFQPRLILMDLQLPGQDGLSLTRQLRGDPAFASIVIIAVTSYAMKGDRERALAAGCDDYVTKPIDTRALPALIARYLASGRPPAV